MDPVNTMKYDELTLMKFADGELDESLTAEIEAARIHDKELQSHLEVYETTRSALIRSSANETVPSHIHDLIDNFSPVKKQNWLTRLVKKNPFKTSIFSAILASIITYQGPLLTGTTVTQFAALTPAINKVPANNDLLLNVNSINNEVFEAAKSESSISSARTSSAYSAYRVPVSDYASSLNEINRQILKALSNNPAIKEVIIQLGDESIIIGVGNIRE